MNKESYDAFSILGTYGRETQDPGSPLLNPKRIMQLVKQDHALSSPEKKSLFTMLNSPEAFDHLLVGATGMAVAKAVAHFSKMSKPAQTLMSLAGYGIGNILYNTISEKKHTSFDKTTGIATIKT